MDKHEAQHDEARPASESQDNGMIGFEADESSLPKGYYYSPFFLGSFCAIGFSLWAGTAAL